MEPSKSKPLTFSEHEATVHKAIVATFDLRGFSAFCNQPEASIAAPRLVKKVFDVLNESLVTSNEWAFFSDSVPPGKLPCPGLIKFTGDGALMLWTLARTQDFPQEFCDRVVETLRKFQGQLAEQLPTCERQWRVHKLPKGARLGIATGIVYALRPPHAFTAWTEPSDYVGYCINLAVRLQDHCPELGFLVHGDLHPGLPGMGRYIATAMKGAQEEPVALFEEDVARVPPEAFQAKFKSVPESLPTATL